MIHPPVYGKAGNSHIEVLLEMLFSVKANPALLSAPLHPLFLKNSSSEKSCKPLRATSFMESFCSKLFDKQTAKDQQFSFKSGLAFSRVLDLRVNPTILVYFKRSFVIRVTCHSTPKPKTCLKPGTWNVRPWTQKVGPRTRI